jgi:putative transposase
LLKAHITSAAISDKQGAKNLLKSVKLKGIKKIWADSGYSGIELREIAAKNGKELEVVKRPSGRMRVYNEQWKAEWIPVERGFTILPRRWVVERTFAWIGRYRRMSKDYEHKTKTSKTMIYLCLMKTMLNRYVKAC